MFSLPKTCFGLLTTKLVALKFRSQKTTFFVSKTRCNQLYSTKNIFWSFCRKIVLFSALLHRRKVFFQFAVSHPAFGLILLKTTFLLDFG